MKITVHDVIQPGEYELFPLEAAPKEPPPPENPDHPTRFQLLDHGTVPPAWEKIHGQTQGQYLAYLDDRTKPPAVSVSTALLSYGNVATYDEWNAIRRAEGYMSSRVAGPRLDMTYVELVPFLVQEHIDAERTQSPEDGFLPDKKRRRS